MRIALAFGGVHRGVTVSILSTAPHYLLYPMEIASSVDIIVDTGQCNFVTLIFREIAFESGRGFRELCFICISRDKIRNLSIYFENLQICMYLSTFVEKFGNHLFLFSNNKNCSELLSRLIIWILENCFSFFEIVAPIRHDSNKWIWGFPTMPFPRLFRRVLVRHSCLAWHASGVWMSSIELSGAHWTIYVPSGFVLRSYHATKLLNLGEWENIFCRSYRGFDGGHCNM